MILLVGMIPLPQSPRFQALNGYDDDARKTLLRVRANAAGVDAELFEIKTTVWVERGWRDLFVARFRR